MGWGGGGGKKKLPKAAPGRSVVGSLKSDHNEKKEASCFVSCSLDEIHHHMHNLKNRWQISPDLDLCPVKSSSLIQVQKG